MTEDQISNGLRTTNQFTKKPFRAVEEPANVESVVAPIAGDDGVSRLWKFNRYYPRRRVDGETPEDWELHDLTGDPEERLNRAAEPGAAFDQMRIVLDLERTRCRRKPRVTNP